MNFEIRLRRRCRNHCAVGAIVTHMSHLVEENVLLMISVVLSQSNLFLTKVIAVYGKVMLLLKSSVARDRTRFRKPSGPPYRVWFLQSSPTSIIIAALNVCYVFIHGKNIQSLRTALYFHVQSHSELVGRMVEVVRTACLHKC